MKIIVPDYYKEFTCIADRCQNTCCKGWEVEIDAESLAQYEKYPEIMEHIERAEDNHFKLEDDETCPFLLENGLCRMILEYGKDTLCQTCTDHPRFRNYWNDRIEMGLGIVCEEAARIILSQKKKMKLEIMSDDGISEDLPEDEAWLMELRDQMIENVEEIGPMARLREYLIYRHIADALYDNRVEERIKFIDILYSKIKNEFEKKEGSLDSLIDIARRISYDIEYDEEEKEKILSEKLLY